MAWITVASDDGTLTWKERAFGEAFESDHYRACLADRLGWAVSDAEALERDAAAGTTPLAAARPGGETPHEPLPAAA